MKLQAFNGGKSSRLEPYLIGINEGVTFSNIDITSAALKPVKKHSSNGLGVEKYAFYFEANAEWVSSSVNRDYVEYQEKVYFTQDDSIPQVYDGISTYNLGIKEPTSAPAIVTVSGSLTGTYTYAYTYYNSGTGAESGISALTEITLSSNSASITNIPSSADPQVTHKRIYRVGGALTEFTLVIEIPDTDVIYVDNIADTAVDGRILEADDYKQAKHGAKYLTEAYSMLFYALGDKVYFTPIGKPWAWPEEFFIGFPLTVTGIGVIANGIIVFTRLRAYIITGNTPETLSKYTLSTTQGCKSHKTIQELGGVLLWLSNDGICASGGGLPKVISRQKLGRLELTPVVAVVLDEVYYLQHTVGSIVYDVRFDEAYTDLNLGNTYLVVGDDKLFGFFADDHYELFKGNELEIFSYLSPLFIDGSYAERKKYKTFYLRSEGNINIEVYLNGKSAGKWSLTTTDTHDLDTKQDMREAYSVQFKISGTGTVHELSYQPYGSERN